VQHEEAESEWGAAVFLKKRSTDAAQKKATPTRALPFFEKNYFERVHIFQ
jgi:hypothetical protein